MTDGETGKIKVLQVYRTFFPDTQGGLEEVIRQIAQNAPQFDIDVKVFVPSINTVVPEMIHVNEIEVHRVPEYCEISSCNIFYKGIGYLKELVEWADIVHYHYPWPFQDILHLFLLRNYNKKIVVTYHSDIIRQRGLTLPYLPFRRLFFREVDVIVATSPHYQASSKVISRYKHKVDVIPLGLDNRTLPTPSEELTERWRKRFGEEFFFFVGVLRYYKGLHLLVKAARKTNATIVIAGEGKQKQVLLDMVNEYQLSNVHILGTIDDEDKVALFSLCRAVVLPSFLRSEAFGITLLEGMSFGRPLITASISTGVSYVNQHYQTGLAVKPNCSSSLADAIECLHNDSELAKRFGENAKMRYLKYFTGEKMGESYAALYKRLMPSQ